MAKNVSDNFRNIIKTGGPFYAYASVLLATGETIIMTSEQDFTLTGNGYSGDGGTGFPLGMALSKSITLNIDNTSIPDSLKDTSSDNILDYKNEDILATRKSIKTDYYQARITLYTEADLPDGTTERIREGIFTVIDAVTPGEILKITAYDDMYKADTPFTSLLSYPASAQALLNEVCAQCGITLGSVTFRNNNFQIQQAPEGLTGRQIIGYIAQIAGGNAVIDSNARLIIKTYDLSGFDQDEEVSADEIETASGIHIVSQYTDDPNIGTDDVTITGVTVEIEHEDTDETEVYTAGTTTYAMSVDNPLISGKEKEAVDLIADVVIGITLRPFSGKFMPDPTIEFMDLAYLVDKNDNQYKTFITTHDFEYLSNSTLSNGTESPERHNGSYYSTAAEVYQKAKKDLKVNRTQWEQAIENLSQQVANASGLYTTEEEQPDGSTIFYMHNKPTLEESDIVWQMTAETLTVSTDGGKTWNAGITVNGEVIARIMNTIGINFDWGVGGTLIVQDEDGNQTAYIDAETGTVRFAVESLTITGKTVQEIASEQSETAINDFVDAVYNPDITNLQAQIDGQIETWFYDYIPTTDNYPASGWTTDTERYKHLGDLFYVVDNTEHGGEAYRWAKINNAYTWDYVEDTAVAKALADAAAAQDTADQKRRVFVTTPTPPYDVGDLWVGNDTSDLMRCQRSRSSGNYDASDWIKAVKYTDDTELYNFVQNDYNTTIQEIYQSVDQKSETWYQDTDPALGWTENENTPLQDLAGENILDLSGDTITTTWEKEKSAHDGDLWKNPSNNVEYIYQDGIWIEMAIPDAVFDTIDGKAQIFVVQPTPPYNIGDTWFTGTTILVCNTRRDSGEFVQSDWAKNDNYTDDSALYDFIEGDYAETIEEIQAQTDQKAETWYQSTDPSSNWTTDEKAGHAGDLWYNTTEQKTYIYNGSTWSETKSNPPDEVFDSIDGKAQIFVSTPAPPYSVGDLWFDSASSDIMTCVTARSSGSFNVSDWEKRNKYTDDSALNEFLSGEYQETIQELKDQADQKAETWYQSNDPAASWSAEEKENHAGDLWYNTGNQNTYIYNGASWQLTKTTPPDDVFDQIDGKAQIFISQPAPPYQEGDLWFNSATSDIMTCVNTRASGDYTASDWQKRNKYTDDSYAQQVNQELSEFISGYQDEIAEIQNSVDQKAETWYQTSDPASQWTDTEDIPLCDVSGNNILDTTGGTIVTIWESEKATHNGDLWHNPSNNNEYIFQDGYWNETSIPDDVFDIIDGKGQIFVNQPVPPYAVGDLWFNSATSDIMTCIQGRSSGSYSASDWQKRNKYTDDTSVTELDDSLDMYGVFNRLTNGGTVQGLYMENGQIYILFTYAKGGVLSLGGKNNGNGYAQILNEDDEVIAELDSNGIGILGQFQVSGENSYGKKSWSILATSELFFYDSQRQVIGYLNAMIDNNGVAAANLTGNDAVTLNLRYNSNQVYKHYILADDNYRLYDQTVKRWHTFFGDERHNGDSYFSKIFFGSDDGNDCYLQYTNYYNSGAISSSGGFYAYGDLGCQGTKHRIVQTDDYQKRLLYSYETPSPYFGDLGCGETDDAGICVIVFDDIFLETVNTKCDYQVFLQKEGPGDIWVESKSFDHIVVRGTPNLKFSWEAKVKQKGYEYQRLEAFELSQDSVESIDYERQAEVMVEKYYKELEEMFV